MAHIDNTEAPSVEWIRLHGDSPGDSRAVLLALLLLLLLTKEE